MFATSSNPPTPAEFAAAIVRAERRQVLVTAMVEFCMALLRALQRGGAMTVDAYCSISRAARFGLNLSMETDRLLAQLQRGVFPAPKAQRAAAPSESAERLEDLETRESAERTDRDPSDRLETENNAGFLSRFETFEAAVGPDWSPLEAARTLCRVLRLEPDWLAALDEGWLDENLDLKRLLAEHRAAPASAENDPEKDKERARVHAPPPTPSRSISSEHRSPRLRHLLSSTAPIIPPPMWRGRHPPPDTAALRWQAA
jgi:hypothetical protein